MLPRISLFLFLLMVPWPMLPRRPGKSDPIRMIQTKQPEILPKFKLKIANLKLVHTENDTHRSKANLNIVH